MKLEDNNAVVGLYQIRKEYSYENDMLVTSYGKDIDLPKKVVVSADSSDNSLSVRLPASDKNIYFGITDDNYMQDRLSLPQAIRIGFLLIGLLLLYSIFEALARKYSSKSWIWVVAFVLVMLAVRFSLLAVGFFDDLSNLKMFSPELLSTSTLLASFGDMLLKVVIVGLVCIFFCRHFNVNLNVF